MSKELKAGERMVTLISGDVVSSYSEEWRRECEARSICRMPGKEARRNYMKKVKEIRGSDEARDLAALVRKVWAAEFRAPVEASA